MSAIIDSILLHDPIIMFELCALGLTLLYLSKLSLTPLHSKNTQQGAVFDSGLFRVGSLIRQFSLSGKDSRAGEQRTFAFHCGGFRGVGSVVALPKRSLRKQRVL